MPANLEADNGSQPIHKTSHDRYVRSGRSRRHTGKVIGLSLSLAIAILILTVVSIFSAVKIASLKSLNRSHEQALQKTQSELDALVPQLESLRGDLDTLIQDRFPDLTPLKVNEMLTIDNHFVKSAVFTVIKRSKKDVYKYLAVLENDSTTKIKPNFRVLLFNEFGVHIATDEVMDEVVLGPGESRDYTAEIKFFFETNPKHFFIDDLTLSQSK